MPIVAAEGARNEIIGETYASRPQPSFSLGASDGGPGEWAVSPKYPKREADAIFQRAVTGAPPGVEYRVPTDRLVSGEKWFDSYNPATGNPVDAKNFWNWPKEDLPFSLKKVGDDLATSDAIAGDLGRSVEVQVATEAKAMLVRQIARERGLENILVRGPRD